jgi:acetyl esterase/lipase
MNTSGTKSSQACAIPIDTISWSRGALAAMVLLALVDAGLGADAASKKSIRPASVREITIESTLDGVAQPAWFLPAPSAHAAPLFVHLHTWSARFDNSGSILEAVTESERRGWNFISPDFRGANNRPEACASRWAIQDVLDAVAYARRHAAVDPARIYLLGASGGGHMALTMAHVAPTLWAGVSAWVPVTDLAELHASSKTKGGTAYWPWSNESAAAHRRRRQPRRNTGRARRSSTWRSRRSCRSTSRSGSATKSSFLSASRLPAQPGKIRFPSSELTERRKLLKTP